MMKLVLIPQSDEMKFQEWFDDHDSDLIYMECEDISRQSFMAGMKAATIGEQNELRKSVEALLLVIEQHTSEHTQYRFMETIGFAKHILGKDGNDDTR